MGLVYRLPFTVYSLIAFSGISLQFTVYGLYWESAVNLNKSELNLSRNQ